MDQRKKKKSFWNVSPQERVAQVAVLTAFMLAVAKFIIAYLTSSMAILASALDSSMDVAASGINFFSIRHALKPADSDHHFGHGKAESLAGFVQGQLMILSGVYVIYSSAEKAFNKNLAVVSLDLGLSVMIFSTIVSALLVLYMRRTAQKTQSIALKADSLHYFTDVLSNFVVLTSLLIIYFFEFYYIDLILSSLIGLFIIYSAWQVLRESIDVLMDKSLDKDKLEQIHNKIQEFYPDVVSYHNLQTRHSGNKIFIDMHLVMPGVKLLSQAHEISQQVMGNLQQLFPNAAINVHVDPCDDRTDPRNRSGGLHQDLEGISTE